jgi:hypothetical protein
LLIGFDSISTLKILIVVQNHAIDGIDSSTIECTDSYTQPKNEKLTKSRKRWKKMVTCPSFRAPMMYYLATLNTINPFIRNVCSHFLFGSSYSYPFDFKSYLNFLHFMHRLSFSIFYVCLDSSRTNQKNIS